MFSHIAAFVAVVAMPLLAAATPASVGADVCANAQVAATCTSIVLATSPIGAEVLGLLDIVVSPLDVRVALGCGPLVSVARRDEGVDVNVCCDTFDHLDAFGEVGLNCEPLVV